MVAIKNNLNDKEDKKEDETELAALKLITTQDVDGSRTKAINALTTKINDLGTKIGLNETAINAMKKDATKTKAVAFSIKSDLADAEAKFRLDSIQLELEDLQFEKEDLEAQIQEFEIYALLGDEQAATNFTRIRALLKENAAAILESEAVIGEKNASKADIAEAKNIAALL
jgi:hypothetical protein